MNDRSTFLFAGHSFLSGAGRTLDLMGVLDEYNRSQTGADADALAIYNDWAIVGEDLMQAIQSIRDSIEHPPEQYELFSETE